MTHVLSLFPSQLQLECLRNYCAQVEANNSNLMQKLSCSKRQLMQVEKCCHQKLDALNRDVEELNTKLCLREDELQSSRECINLKVMIFFSQFVYIVRFIVIWILIKKVY